MWKLVKRLLKKYKYLPEDYDFTISTIISQCELWRDKMEFQKEESLYKYVSEVELSKAAEAQHLIRRMILRRKHERFRM